MASRRVSRYRRTMSPGKIDSQAGIFPARSLPEILKSEMEVVFSWLESRFPVNELNSRRRVTRCGS